MLKGATLFLLVFVFITPQTRGFLGGVFAHTGENLQAYAPFSYILLGLLLAAPVVSLFVMKTWPEREEPENPMAKYRREVPDED